LLEFPPGVNQFCLARDDDPLIVDLFNRGLLSLLDLPFQQIGAIEPQLQHALGDAVVGRRGHPFPVGHRAIADRAEDLLADDRFHTVLLPLGLP